MLSSRSTPKTVAPTPAMSEAPTSALQPTQDEDTTTSRPDVVQMAIELSHCWDLNVKTESFCVELVIFYKWKVDAEDAEAVLKASGGDENESWEPEWYPRIKVHNITAALTDRVREFEAFRHKSTGDVWVKGKMELSVMINESYNLEAFPFDMQWLECKIEVSNAVKIAPMTTRPDRAWGMGFRAPVLVLPSGVGRLPDFKLSDQIPVSYRFEEGSKKKPSEVTLILMYDRAYQYHIFNSYGVLCGIGTVCLAIWSLPVTEVGSRLSLDITLLLVAVAFKQVLSSELPPVSYLTILDRYALTTTLFVFGATWLHGLAGLFEAEGLELGTVRTFDVCAVAFYAISFALYNTWHYAYVRTQLFFNDVMTDEGELPVHGFRAAQMGQTDEDGMPTGDAESGSLIYGKYANRPVTAQGLEVFSVIALLLSGIGRDEAKARHKAQMEAKMEAEKGNVDYKVLPPEA